MVTGELKSKVDSLWGIFWTGGLTNPLDVVEQMTYETEGGTLGLMKQGWITWNGSQYYLTETKD